MLLESKNALRGISLKPCDLALAWANKLPEYRQVNSPSTGKLKFADHDCGMAAFLDVILFATRATPAVSDFLGSHVNTNGFNIGQDMSAAPAVRLAPRLCWYSIAT